MKKVTWSPQALRVLHERYLVRNLDGRVTETPEQMCQRVALEAAWAEENYGGGKKEIESWAKKYYQLLTSRRFLPNSPTLMNAGTQNGLQYSACFVLPVGDSLVEIFDTVKNAAIIHQSGGGTGFSFSRLRPRGSVVRRSRGVASGPISFMRIFDAATEQIKQGGKRRGANMGILRVDHPDILEFIHCKEGGGITNFNISVAATEEFMEALAKGKDYQLVAMHTGKVVGRLSAQKVFDEICESAWRTGDPGMVFIDRINAGPSNPVPSLGPVEATNPCFAEGTLLATEKGWLPIEKIAKDYPEGGLKIVTDKGRLLPISQALYTGKKETLKIKTSLGYELIVTPEHKVMTKRGWVEARNLKGGEDEVFIQDQEIRFRGKTTLDFKFPRQFKGDNGRIYTNNYPNKWSQELGLVLGWLTGDGWLRGGDINCRVGFSFGRDDLGMLKKLKPLINAWYQHKVEEIEREGSKYFVQYLQQLGVKAVKAEEKEVPPALYTAPRSAVVGFLQGIFTADGTVRDNPQSNSSWVALSAKNRKLLRGVQLLLLSLGIKSQIMNRSRPARRGVFRYQTVKGEKRSYAADGILYELGIFGESRERFRQKVGFLSEKQERLNGVRFKGFYKKKATAEVISVEPAGIRRVYDLTEPVTHSVVANGIISHQCGEQPLYPYDACNLGSIFLKYFVKGRRKEVDWDGLAETTHLAVRFLDSVIDRNPFPLPEIKETVESIRRIGLGVGGWADMLVQLGIPYDSNAALKLAEKVMGFIQKNAVKASEDLAKERAPFSLFEKSIYKNEPPRRNSTVTTIAPTGSIGIIADAATGIEPYFALAYRHIVKDKELERELTFVNPFFEEKAKGYSWYTGAVKKEVLSTGHLRGIKGVPKKVQEVFATAHDIDYQWHVKTQAAFQKFTDNAVSKTVNLPNTATVKDVKNAYLLAYKTGCLGITVYRDGCKEAQVLNLGVAEKKAAEAAELGTQLKPRPLILKGQTFRVPTPFGTAFITVNSDEGGTPFEVFVNVGKAGMETAAMAEALGRMISLSLRIPSGLEARRVVAAIVDQLSGIGGANHVGFGKQRVRSLADAIAKVLTEYLAVGGGEKIKSSKRDLCPECGAAALIFEEGCYKCLSCGYSKC